MANKKYPKRYHEYRGRRKRGNPVLKIIIALLALVLLACLVFLVFLGGRVEYTDEGVRLVLPWSDEPGHTDDPVGTENPTPPVIIIEDPEESPEPDPELSPQPDPAPEVIGAVEVTAAQLLDGTAAQLVADAGGNTLVVEMKSRSGQVYWNSAVADSKLIAGDVTAAVADLAAAGELHLVARVVCFRDLALADAGMGGPLMTKGGNVWYDRHGLRWVSPADGEVRGYLTRLCLELAAMGFDEILLECAGYPYFGEVHVLTTDQLRPEDLSAPVAQFWQEVKAALAEEGVQLSALVTEEMVLGTDVYSGITPDLLAQYADRVWVKAVQEPPADLADKLVTVDGSRDQGSWADISGVSR